MEGYGPSSYGDAFADVYDEWYGAGAGQAGDPQAAAAALAELAGGGAVLELGVGSGRLAVPLAERGVPVWGIDASAAMLDRLAARPGGDKVRAVLGDMADPAAALAGAGAPRFAVVVAAFNTFFLLADDGAQERCLQGCAGLLAPGGAIVLECYVPGAPPAGVERVVEPARVAVDHVVLTVTEHDPVRQRVVGQHVELRAGGTRLRPWVLRYRYPEQLDELAAAAGLRLQGRWAGWDRRPFTELDRAHVSLYQAA